VLPVEEVVLGVVVVVDVAGGFCANATPVKASRTRLWAKTEAAARLR
jgi:hypothetical protein